VDDETREKLDDIEKSIKLLLKQIDFMMQMDQRSLLVLSNLAYVLERTSNKVFDLEEAPGEPDPERIEKCFSDIQKWFAEQITIMGKHDV
jgi:hypothetical protein